MPVYKKNNKFYSRFQMNGERYHYLCRGATTKSEAEKIENQFKYKLQQQQNGVIPKDELQITFKKLYKLYDRYASLNKKSYDKDLSFVKVLKYYFPENSIASDKTPNDFETFKSEIIDDREIKPTTVNRYLNTLSKMYSLAVDEKIIKENPLKSVKRFSDDNYIIRYLTKDEEYRLYASIKEKRPYLEPLITCGLQTGMRRGEIFNLKWENINFDYKFINITKSKTLKGRRKIPISNKLMDVLTSVQIVSEYVFPNPKTGKAYIDIKHSWSTICENAQIKDFRFHDLRHTAITRMVEKGIPLPVVQEIAGHSKIETTMRYTHTSPQQKIDAIEVLNSYC